MSGEEIKEAFGDKEVLEMEEYKKELLGFVDELRAQIDQSWHDMDAVDQMTEQIDRIQESLDALSKKIREAKKKFNLGLAA